MALSREGVYDVGDWGGLSGLEGLWFWMGTSCFTVMLCRKSVINFDKHSHYTKSRETKRMPDSFKTNIMYCGFINIRWHQFLWILWQSKFQWYVNSFSLHLSIHYVIRNWTSLDIKLSWINSTTKSRKIGT